MKKDDMLNDGAECLSVLTYHWTPKQVVCTKIWEVIICMKISEVVAAFVISTIVRARFPRTGRRDIEQNLNDAISWWKWKPAEIGRLGIFLQDEMETALGTVW